MIPPAITGMSCGAGLAQPLQHVRAPAAACEPDRIDRPTQCTSSASGRVHDLLGGEPDALVDHLEARRHGPVRRSARRRWSARPGRACRPAAAACRRPGPRPSASTFGGPRPARVPSSAVTATGARRHAGRGPELAEHLAQGPGPLAGRDPGAGALQGGLHEVVGALRRPPSARSSALQGRGWLKGGWSRVSRQSCSGGDHPRLDRRVDRHGSPRPGRR